MVELITVAPDDSSWAVAQDSSSLLHRFESGGAAEAMARELAANLAVVGRPTEIRIYLRDGSLAGKFVSSPEPA